MNLIFDLDGTLANFNASGGINNMWKKGFFANLEPYPNGLQMVENLSKDYNIFVLSTCIRNKYCKAEKMEWIAKHLPFVPTENIILINTGEVKAEEWKKYVGRDLQECDVLFDDYKENLNAWNVASGSAVKCGQVFKRNRPYKFQLIRFNAIYEILNRLITI